MTYETQRIVDFELLGYQKDLDEHFAEWLRNPKIDKKEEGDGGGGQGELEEYLKIWKKEYFSMFKMVLTVSDDVEIPGGIDQNKITKGDGFVEIELDDFDAPHWLQEQHDGLLMNLNKDGVIELSKREKGKYDYDFKWDINVDQVVDMKWKRSTDEIVPVNAAESGVIIKRAEELAKLMELSAESDRRVRVVWDGDDSIWIVTGINFGGSSPEVYMHCDKYINPDAHSELSELARENARFVLEKPPRVYNFDS